MRNWSPPVSMPVRHPIYTGIIALVLGLFLRKPTLLVAITTVVVIAYVILKVRIEERLLLARYRNYAGYRSRTFGLFRWFRPWAVEETTARSPAHAPAAMGDLEIDHVRASNQIKGLRAHRR